MAKKSNKEKRSVWQKIFMAVFVLAAFLLVGRYAYQHYQELKAKVAPLKVYRPSGPLSGQADSVYAKQIRKMIEWNPHKAQKKVKIGYVAIPSRRILLPIYVDPYSKSSLDIGAASLSGQTLGTNDNFTLAAHNFNNGVTGFSSLQIKENSNSPYLVAGKTKKVDKLKNQPIFAADNKNIYIYRILSQSTVYKTDVSVMDSDRVIDKKPTMTIISCLFPNIDYRIITKATLSKEYPILKAPKKILRVFDMRKNQTNAHVNWFNPGQEEGANGAGGGYFKK
ncbi:class A sortase [Oenococcus alcoholitolerans]|uniref:class A sortase n=1 Tax=Oenococcus alcoholitolerans TaxID=931074 RepID=UPI003F723337